MSFYSLTNIYFTVAPFYLPLVTLSLLSHYCFISPITPQFPLCYSFTPLFHSFTPLSFLYSPLSLLYSPLSLIYSPVTPFLPSVTYLSPLCYSVISPLPLFHLPSRALASDPLCRDAAEENRSSKHEEEDTDARHELDASLEMKMRMKTKTRMRRGATNQVLDNFTKRLPGRRS